MDRLALLADAIAQTSSRTRKLQLAAAYFRTLDDADLARAVRFLTAAPIADSETQLSIGRARLREALARIVPWDTDTLSLCFSQVGDSGETIGLLLEGHTRNQPLTLTEAELWFQRLHAARTTAAKVDLLEAAFLSFRPALLHKSEPCVAWPSPRSWEMASTLHGIGLDIGAAVGAPAANEFGAFVGMYADLPDIGVHLEKPRPDGTGMWDADYALSFMRRNVSSSIRPPGSGANHVRSSTTLLRI